MPGTRHGSKASLQQLTISSISHADVYEASEIEAPSWSALGLELTN
jgi:hypothetical protein